MFFLESKKLGKIYREKKSKAKKNFVQHFYNKLVICYIIVHFFLLFFWFFGVHFDF